MSTMPWIFNLSSADHEEVDGCSSPTSSTTSSSSIGKNSDLRGSGPSSSDGEDSISKEESEVQSVYKGRTNLIGALEEALPIRRGISEFYNGRSKSIACLADAASYSSIKDIVKPDNAYNRKQRNLLAFKLRHKRSKRPIRSRGSSTEMPQGAAYSRCESINSSNNADSSSSNSNFLGPIKLKSPKNLRITSNLRSAASYNNIVLLSSVPHNVPLRRSISLPVLLIESSD